MGLLDRLRRNRDDDDEDEDDDQIDEDEDEDQDEDEDDDDDQAGRGFLGKIRGSGRLFGRGRRGGGDDDEEDEDEDEDGGDDDGPEEGGGGFLRRLRGSRLLGRRRRGSDDDDDEDDEDDEDDDEGDAPPRRAARPRARTALPEDVTAGQPSPADDGAPEDAGDAATVVAKPVDLNAVRAARAAAEEQGVEEGPATINFGEALADEAETDNVAGLLGSDFTATALEEDEDDSNDDPDLMSLMGASQQEAVVDENLRDLANSVEEIVAADLAAELFDFYRGLENIRPG